MPRLLPRKGSGSDSASDAAQLFRYDAPRQVRDTVIDFTSLGLPEDVGLALAEAFWSHVGIFSECYIHTQWRHIKTFAQFARESGALGRLADLHRALLLRYIEWLNARRRSGGEPWAKSTRAAAYATLRTLLKWVERCRPGVIASIEYPFNAFPGKDSDALPHSKMPADELRALLRACEADIAQARDAREAARAQRLTDCGTPGTLGWLLQHVDLHCRGIFPSKRELSRSGQNPIRRTLRRLGGLKQVEPCLYPRAESLLPYYLAIMIHTAGNPEPIAELERDCLQSLPLLDDRQVLVWFKARAHSVQRRTFSSTDRFEPPALVREIAEWNERLRPLAPAALRERLLLYKGVNGVTAMSSRAIQGALKSFRERHGLPRFTLVSIRPSVLACFYRATGDLRRVRTIANHARLSTTVRYVLTPEVQAQHRARIAGLQNAFIGHIQQPRSTGTAAPVVPNGNGCVVPPGEVVSMFGFGCTDPFAGAAPGTHRGQLCTHFMGCFTCPNAIITPDPSTVARLLQARDHLRAAATALHPARWQAFYAPQLCILEEDILARFTASELAAAEPLMAQLPSLPNLR